MTIQTIGSNTVKSYQSLIDFFASVAYDFDGAFVNVPDYDVNPRGCTNFWNLYKKRAKKEGMQSQWDELFSTGKPWKNPRTDVWRFYFNLNAADKQAQRQKAIDERREMAETALHALEMGPDAFLENMTMPDCEMARSMNDESMEYTPESDEIPFQTMTNSNLGGMTDAELREALTLN